MFASRLLSARRIPDRSADPSPDGTAPEWPVPYLAMGAWGVGAAVGSAGLTIGGEPTGLAWAVALPVLGIGPLSFGLLSRLRGRGAPSRSDRDPDPVGAVPGPSPATPIPIPRVGVRPSDRPRAPVRRPAEATPAAEPTTAPVQPVPEGTPAPPNPAEPRAVEELAPGEIESVTRMLAELDEIARALGRRTEGAPDRVRTLQGALTGDHRIICTECDLPLPPGRSASLFCRSCGGPVCRSCVSELRDDGHAEECGLCWAVRIARPVPTVASAASTHSPPGPIEAPAEERSPSSRPAAWAPQLFGR